MVPDLRSLSLVIRKQHDMGAPKRSSPCIGYKRHPEDSDHFVGSTVFEMNFVFKRTDQSHSGDTTVLIPRLFQVISFM